MTGEPTLHAHPSDDDLFDAVRRGDRAALGTLFERHYEDIVRFAARMVGDPVEAADAAGSPDAFVDNEGEPLAVLITIAPAFVDPQPR